MTEHIIQFGVGIDDDAIIKSVEQNASKQIVADIETAILNKLFIRKYYGESAATVDRCTGKPKLDRDALFSRFAEDAVAKTMEKYKDEIIRTAAEMLTEKYTRTKAWKEAAGEAIRKVKE